MTQEREGAKVEGERQSCKSLLRSHGVTTASDKAVAALLVRTADSTASFDGRVITTSSRRINAATDAMKQRDATLAAGTLSLIALGCLSAVALYLI